VKRNINEETCRHWNYQVGEKSGKPVQIANYCDDQGYVVAQKLRFPDKSFSFVGEPKKAGLYGQHLWRDHGRKVVITEGEIDALSVSQLQGNKWPVVSVPNGAQGAKKSVAKAIEWLEHFDEVIFMFDDDEPGREAAKECAELLTPGKAKIARIPGFKDANEALQAGQGAKVIDAIWGAKAYRPDGVLMVDELFDTAFEIAPDGIPWPWKSLTEKTYGIRPKELYAFGGGVGCGKSNVFKEIALHLIKLGHRCGYLAFEEAPGHTLKAIVGKLVGRRLHIPGVTVTAEELESAKRYLDGNLALFDHFGAMDADIVEERVRYMVTALGCRHIFIDHLTAIAAAEEGDERRAIDKLMARWSALTQQLDFTLYFVSHLATPEGKPHEEGGRVMEKHFRGSRSIAQWSHAMFGIERNKQEPEAPTMFRVLKDRFTGDANGVTFGLAYDRNTGRLSECSLSPPDNPGFKDETGDAEF
jgi:twinkle protein